MAELVAALNEFWGAERVTEPACPETDLRATAGLNDI